MQKISVECSLDFKASSEVASKFLQYIKDFEGYVLRSLEFELQENIDDPSIIKQRQDCLDILDSTKVIQKWIEEANKLNYGVAL